MTTTVKFTHVRGNKAVELVDANDLVHAVLDAPGRSVEILVHGDLSITARETGEFFQGGAPAQVPNASVDYGNTDAGQYEGRKDLPPGAGEDGSNVPDTRVD